MVNKQRLRAYALLVFVFVLGMVAGGGAAFAYSLREYREFASGGDEAFERRRIEAMAAELELSAEQKERVRKIFENHREEHRRLLRSVFERCGKSMEAHRAKVHAEIQSLLTPEQRVRHDDLVKRRKARFFKTNAPKER